MALVVTLMSMMLICALGMALALLTMTETAISANYREGAETLYAAEGAVEYVMQEVQRVRDWNLVVEGTAPSAFIDGPPNGTRNVGAATLDLTQATEEVRAEVDEGLWGDTPHWELYAHGRLDEVLTPATARSRVYTVVWVADGPEVGVLAIRGHGYGPNGSRRAVEVTVARPDTSADTELNPLRVRSWRELR